MCAICLLLIPRAAGYVSLRDVFHRLVMIHTFNLDVRTTIAAIVILRHYLIRVQADRALALASHRSRYRRIFIAAQVTAMAVPGRSCRLSATGWRIPSQTDAELCYIWSQPLSKEIWDTGQRLPHNLLGVPGFALRIGCTRRWAIFRDLIARIMETLAASRCAIVGVAWLYRHVARIFDSEGDSRGVCLFLILHAVKTRRVKDVPPISGDDRKTMAFGWINTLIPRVGIVRPF